MYVDGYPWFSYKNKLKAIYRQVMNSISLYFNDVITSLPKQMEYFLKLSQVNKGFPETLEPPRTPPGLNFYIK